MLSPVKMKEMPAKADTCKTGLLCLFQQDEPVMIGKGNIHRDGPVPGVWHTANMRIPAFAAMS